MNLPQICDKLRLAYETLSLQSASQKNNALSFVIKSIDKNRKSILDANALDVLEAQKKGTSESLIDRLSLDDARLTSILNGIQSVIEQKDPIGEVTSGWRTPNGLEIKCVRVPLGVVGIIYESRPNVTVDAFCLAYKSGNAILLRGSSAALNSNKAFVATIKQGLSSCKDGTPNAIELIESTDHNDVPKIITAKGLLDVVLPRGSATLIKTVVENAKVPVIETGSGVCHLYVDDDADLQMAVRIAENAKIQRPAVCNAIEAILVHKKILKDFIPLLLRTFQGRVKFHADDECYKELQKCTTDDNKKQSFILHASVEDYGHEFLDYECLIMQVASVEDAIQYINVHNTKHSECIVTNNRQKARLFQARVDASCVYVNASTRFTDGGEFGFGAELGISTQKLHARGPMGLCALTTTKYFIDGEGQIR